MNKNDFSKCMLELIQTDDSNIRKELEIKLYSLVSNAKLNLTAETEKTTKAQVIHDIRNFVRSPDNNNKSLLLMHLQLFPMVLIN
jgi:hypothetical protein